MDNYIHTLALILANTLPPSSIIVEDPIDLYYKSLCPGAEPDFDALVIAKESSAVHSIVVLVGNNQHVNCSHHQSLAESARASHPSYTQSLASVANYALSTPSSYEPDIPDPISINNSSSTDIARYAQHNTTATHSTPFHQHQHLSSNSTDINSSQYASSFTALEDSLPFALSSNSDIHKPFSKITKKYKPVALKTKPVASMLPSQFCIIRNIVGNLLAKCPLLCPPSRPPPRPPDATFFIIFLTYSFSLFLLIIVYYRVSHSRI